MTCIVRPLARCGRRDPAGLEVVARLRRARHRLGLDYSSVTPETLAHAYKARAIACHPDRGGDSAAMARLNADRDLVRALLDDSGQQFLNAQ